MSAADDRELERYLQRSDALSRAYANLKTERPSPALDQAVLARARDALQGQPHARSLLQRRWPALTALAATVLLSFAVVMRLALEPDSQPRESASPLESRRVIESEIEAATEHAPASVESLPQPAPPQAAEHVDEVPKEGDATVRPVAPAPSRDTRDVADEPAAQFSRARSMPVPAVTVDGSVSTESAKSPEVWLGEIEELRAAGMFEAAERELERFKAAYPGYLETRQRQSAHDTR